MANTNLSRDRRLPAGPPTGRNKAQFDSSRRQTARGQRVEPKGAAPGQGPTPDATVRQRVLNRGADSRRNGDGGASRLEEGQDRGVMGPPRRPRPIGSPPGQAAPPRSDSRAPNGGPMPGSPEFAGLSRPEQIQIERSMGGGPGSGRSNQEIVQGQQQGQQVQGGAAAPPPGVAGPPRIGEERRTPTAPTQPVIGTPGVEGGPPASGQIAAGATGDFGPEQADQVRATAAAEADSGQMPQPPGGVDEQGNFRPEPGMAPQQAAEAIQAQSEGVMQEQKPEPALPKSPLGADSPIEQADAGGKLRAGTRHHLRALGFQTSGMDPTTAKRFERQAVRDFDQFGEYPGMDDPHSPAPPIRPGKHSFNPMTGQWVRPEGQISVLDRLAPVGAKGPDTAFTIDAVKKGEV